MWKIVPFVMGMVWIAQIQAEDKTCGPVPKGWQPEVRAAAGTLCADVLLGTDEEGTRKLRVYEAGRPAFESADAALCKNCGGVLGDPFQGIEWQGQTLAVSNYGGSRETWGETWKFAQRGGRWLVAGWDREYIDRAVGDVWTESVNTLAGKATANFEPGAESKRKARKLSCRRQGPAPGPGAVAGIREKESLACGMKLDWEG